MKKSILLLTLLCATILGRAETKCVTLGDKHIHAEVCYDKEAGTAFLKSLCDPRHGVQWEMAERQSLFILYFSDRAITSTEGWSEMDLQQGKRNATFTFRWKEGYTVEVCFDWAKEMHVRWGNCSFPTEAEFYSSVLMPLTIRGLSSGTKVFYPYASGIVYDPEKDSREDSAIYPAGFGASMPWFALWNDRGMGLYYAALSAKAGMKTLNMKLQADRSAKMEFNCPAYQPSGSRPTLTPCDIVLRPYEGDWFDAAMIYKKWMKENSYWHEQVQWGKNGRTDTPQWMKELCIWAMGSDEEVKAFRRAIGIPVGFHWYNWHQIPFDNDYPHYIPARAQFAEKVKSLQEEGVYVMPYINGRLWDTHDHGTSDSLFTSYALPAATKTRENGNPNIEDYGSKESDGSNVKLAVMCPSTDLWQNKMKEVVLTLLSPTDKGGYGVNAVYMDQIAAAPPAPCWDESHPHEKGSSDWWVPAYTKLLQGIRKEMPEGKMLTTESNADGYTGVMDGFLTWQFQSNHQVPAFAAVYGGMIQLFGRSNNFTQESLLATRMKLAQSLVFGEQLGWLSASITKDEERFGYLKQLALLRYKFRAYFYNGEMVHAPALRGENPVCEVEWVFHGPTPIENPSVLTSAWRMNDKKHAIVILANYTDTPYTLNVTLPKEIAPLAKSGLVLHDTDGKKTRFDKMPSAITIPARGTFVLEAGKPYTKQ